MLKSMLNRYRTITVVLFLLILTISGAGVAERSLLHALTAMRPTTRTSAAPTRPFAQTDPSLQADIDALLQRATNLDLSVSVTDISTAIEHHYGSTDPAEAASVAKLFTAIMYLHQVEQGHAALSDTIDGDSAQRQLERMIVESDNDAWQSLNNVLTLSGLNEYSASIGLASFDASANTVKSSDIGLLLTKLYRQELLDSSYTQLLLSYMERAGQRDFIVADAPPGAKVYHKAGWLEDRLNDSAIISSGGRTYALVIFSKDRSGEYDYAAGEAVFAAITQRIAHAFQAASL
jgi:beta-lactamase class A